MKIGIEVQLDPQQINAIATELQERYPEVYNAIHLAGYDLCEQNYNYDDGYCHNCGCSDCHC